MYEIQKMLSSSLFDAFYLIIAEIPLNGGFQGDKIPNPMAKDLTPFLGTRSHFFEERNVFLFSEEERGMERVPEIRGTKLRSVPRSFFPNLPMINLN